MLNRTFFFILVEFLYLEGHHKNISSRDSLPSLVSCTNFYISLHFLEFPLLFFFAKLFSLDWKLFNIFFALFKGNYLYISKRLFNRYCMFKQQTDGCVFGFLLFHFIRKDFDFPDHFNDSNRYFIKNLNYILFFIKPDL